jgi:hypothetical protein
MPQEESDDPPDALLLAESLYWQLVELEPTFPFNSYACYPLGHIVKRIKSAQRRVNASQFSQALAALEFYFANSSAENATKRKLQDYLPYNIVEDKKASTVFSAFSKSEKRVIQSMLEKNRFSNRVHGLIHALGWIDV